MIPRVPGSFRARLPRCLGGCALIAAVVWLASFASAVFAAEFTVVLSDDSAPYEEAYQAIRTRLEERGHGVSRLHADRLDAAALEPSSLVVAIGVNATEALIPLSSRRAVLAILVPRDWFQTRAQPELLRAGAKAVSAIYVDQPIARQARLIRLAFPDARRIGVVTGEKQEALLKRLDAELRRQGLVLVHETVSAPRALIPTLESVLAASDLLLALPDPVAFSRGTAQSVFLTSYRYRDPVLGYSRSLTRAGALLSLYSTPEQVGRQAAEWIESRWLPTSSLPEAAHPAHFSVSANQQVARSLGVALPAEAILLERLGGEP